MLPNMFAVFYRKPIFFKMHKQIHFITGNLCSAAEHSNDLRVVLQILVSLTFFLLKQYTIFLKDIK